MSQLTCGSDPVPDGLESIIAVDVDHEVTGLSLDEEPPTLRVRADKGNRSRIVPIHPELRAALRSALSYGSIKHGETRRCPSVDGVALGPEG